MVFVVLSILFVCFPSRVGSKNLFKYPPCFNLFRLVSSSPSFLMDLLKNTLSFLHWSLNHLLHLQSRFLQLLGYNLNFTEAVYTVLSLRNLTYLDIHMKNCDLWCKVKKKNEKRVSVENYCSCKWRLRKCTKGYIWKQTGRDDKNKTFKMTC